MSHVDPILDKAIRRVPDFPKPGIMFYDISSLLMDTEAFAYAMDKATELYRDEPIDLIAGVDARGFLFAAPLALALKKPCLLIRKKGKLPGKVIEESFSLEYGKDAVQIKAEDVKPGSRVLIVDDLIATGGTITAGANLIAKAGGKATHVFGIVGLPFLNYEEVLEGMKVDTLINFYSE